MKRVTLKAAVEADAIVIRASAPEATTIVRLQRYFRVEVENALGQFVSGAGEVGGALPKAEDYVTVKALTEVLRLPVVRGDVLSIGGLVFSEAAARPRVRVTYRATDRLMPNLPKNKQASFFSGPADVVSEPIMV